MNRRSFISVVACGGSLTVTGCLSFLGFGCPDPTLENELSYESYDPGGLLGEFEEGAGLITTLDQADRFQSQYFEKEDEDWIRKTDFDEKIVLGIQVGSSGQSSPLKVLGVNQETPEIVHVYSCIDESGQTDDWAPYNKLLRVPHNGRIANQAKLTHWEEGEKRMFGGLTRNPTRVL